MVVSDNFSDQDVHVIAIDKSGTTHTAVSNGRSSAADTVNQSQWTFRDLPPDEIDRFAFQVRDYEWVEFRDLPVNPKLDTAEDNCDPTNINAIDEDGDKSAHTPSKPLVIGDRFVVCPLTTDLQRSLLGGVDTPARNASVCLFVNADAFPAEGPIDEQTRGLKKLVQALPNYRVNDDSEIWLRLVDAYVGDVSLEQRTKQMDELEKLFRKIATDSGFRRVRVSQTFRAKDFNVQGDPWTDYVERARDAADPTKGDETPVVRTDQLRVTPVSTFLSNLLVNADCVVQFLPIARDAEGQRFEANVLPAVAEAVGRLKSAGGKNLLISIRYSKAMKPEIEAWINDNPGRRAYARQLGFEFCNVSMSQIAAEEERESSDPTSEEESGAATKQEASAAKDDTASLFHLQEVRVLTSDKEIEAAQNDPRTNVVDGSHLVGRTEWLAWPSDASSLLARSDIADVAVRPTSEDATHYEVRVTLTRAAGDRLHEATSRIVEKRDENLRLAIIVGGEVLVAPRVYSPIRQEFVLSGSSFKSREAAEEVANKIKPSPSDEDAENGDGRVSTQQEAND